MGRQRGRDVTPDRGPRLMAERLCRNVSRASLARYIEVDSSTLYRWETGEYPAPKWAEICYFSYFDKYNKQSQQS